MTKKPSTKVKAERSSVPLSGEKAKPARTLREIGNDLMADGDVLPEIHPPGNASAGRSSPPRDAEDGEARKRRRPPQRDSLMALTTLCDLWHSPRSDAFVTFSVKGHCQNWPIRSSAFKRWLASRAYEESGLVPGAQAIEDTLRVLEARATNEGPCRAPWLRVGRRGDRHYIDLCDDSWRVVEITGKGWRILDKHDAPFIRTAAMLPLPEPEGACEISEARRFLNVADDDSFALAVSWLVTALTDAGEYPIVVLNGEQGSGKSTAARLLRSLVDPNQAPIRSIPKDERDLVIAAMNGHVIALDNLSKVDQSLSDGLCRISTGGGFATRQLHTDSDEVIFAGSRPIVLNGIPLLTDKADLADRSINIRLRSIPDHERQPESDFWREWEQARPRVLGALLDAFVQGVARVETVKSDWFPRMASFAKWSMACEPGFGWEPGTFRAAYSANRSDAADATFEADPVANALVAMINSPCVQGRWEGSAAELLASIGDYATDAIKRSRRWPLSAQGVGNALDRAAPLLRGKGVEFSRHKSGVRTITIWRKDAAA
jgi:putative DNA primase/helicase